MSPNREDVLMEPGVTMGPEMIDPEFRNRTTPFDIVSTALSSVIALPDPEAAFALNSRILAWNVIDKLHERSYVERGLIAIQFEKKQLWKHLIDPDVGQPFENFTSWMSCSQFMGCRRTNFEAKRTMSLLDDVPAEKLIDVPKGNLNTLIQLSTAVRNDPSILAAAKTLQPEKFLEKVEKEQPLQHLESRKPLHLMLGRCDRKVIDRWTEHAITNGIAGSVTEAIVRACELAMDDVELDEEMNYEHEHIEEVPN